MLRCAPLLVASCLLGACTSDHDRLARVEGEGGAGGQGGELSVTTGSGGAGGASTGGSVVEPPGPNRLTVVNGIVDSDAVAFCFAPYPEGPGAEAPWPSSQGLPFAAVSSVASPAELVVAGQDVQVFVFGGGLGSLAGRSCGELVASTPAGVVAASLGVLPASVFESERSVLVTATGCLGGPGHDDVNQAQICGPLYAADAPSATMVAGFMSRLGGGDKLALQAVHAVAGLEEARVRIRSAIDEATSFVVVAEGWSFGAIAPHPPYAELDEVALGPIEATKLELYLGAASSPASVTAVSEALEHGALSGDEVVAAGGAVFVAVGAAPGIPPGLWWNTLTFAAALPAAED